MDGLTTYNAYGPGRPWHGATGVVREGETGEEAIERLIARWEGRLCARCDGALRVRGIYHVCVRCNHEVIADGRQE